MHYFSEMQIFRLTNECTKARYYPGHLSYVPIRKQDKNKYTFDNNQATLYFVVKYLIKANNMLYKHELSVFTF